MKVNPQKSVLISRGQIIKGRTHTEHSLRDVSHSMEEGIKYLGFLLKPNNYLSND